MATAKKSLDDYFEDESFDSLQKTHRGKKPNQKLKPYLVLQILVEHAE